MTPKTIALAVALFCVTTSSPAIALSQDIGGISCDVISSYVATSPAYLEVFQSYLEGYLEGEKIAVNRASDANVATLLAKAVVFCDSHRTASFASAVAATVDK